MNEAFESIPELVIEWYEEWYSRVEWYMGEYISSPDRLKFDPRFFLKLALWHDKLHPKLEDEELFTEEWLPKRLWLDPYITLDKSTFEKFIQHKDKFWKFENYLLVWTNPSNPNTVHVSFSLSDAFGNETLKDIKTWKQMEEQAQILAEDWNDFWSTNIINAFKGISDIKLYENGNSNWPKILRSWNKISNVEDATKDSIKGVLMKN